MSRHASDKRADRAHKKGARAATDELSEEEIKLAASAQAASDTPARPRARPRPSGPPSAA